MELIKSSFVRVSVGVVFNARIYIQGDPKKLAHCFVRLYCIKY